MPIRVGFSNTLIAGGLGFSLYADGVDDHETDRKPGEAARAVAVVDGEPQATVGRALEVEAATPDPE